MDIIRAEEPIPRKIVERLLRASAPERVNDLEEIWRHYNPTFCITVDRVGARMGARGHRVLFDHKTLSVYWLLSFAGWRALECYSPAIFCSLPASFLAHAFGLDEQLVSAILPAAMTIADVIKEDRGVTKVEAGLEEKIYCAHELLKSPTIDGNGWPAEVPLPGADRDTLKNPQDKAVFDLACTSTAYAFCHEIRHAMFAKDGNPPPAPAEEEIACDAWAREFLTAKLGAYAKREKLDFDKVLAKRSMAGAIGIFVLYETTRRDGDAGTDDYPPLADRMNATLQGTALSSTDSFWILYASVLLAILRRRSKTPAIRSDDPKQLCELLVDEIRRTS